MTLRVAIAWKLVWVPAGGFTRFILVDDAGKQLATGVPTGKGAQPRRPFTRITPHRILKRAASAHMCFFLICHYMFEEYELRLNPDLP